MPLFPTSSLFLRKAAARSVPARRSFRCAQAPTVHPPNFQRASQAQLNFRCRGSTGRLTLSASATASCESPRARRSVCISSCRVRSPPGKTIPENPAVSHQPVVNYPLHFGKKFSSAVCRTSDSIESPPQPSSRRPGRRERRCAPRRRKSEAAPDQWLKRPPSKWPFRVRGPARTPRRSTPCERNNAGPSGKAEGKRT